MFELVLIIPTGYVNELDTELKTKKNGTKKNVFIIEDIFSIFPFSFLDFPDVCVYTHKPIQAHTAIAK